MDLLKILRSFEEFLFEAVTWLYFYPRTLWRIVRRPLGMMAYSDAEEVQPEEQRYDDSLSPPVLLLITLVLTGALAWVAHIPSPTGTSTLSKALLSTQQNQILFRCLVFSLIPLLSALTLLHRQGVAVSRERLRGPFYAQCYLAAPCVIGVSIASIGLEAGGWWALAGWAGIAATLVWLLSVQAIWFKRGLGVSMPVAARLALWSFVQAMIYLLLIILPVALI